MQPYEKMGQMGAMPGGPNVNQPQQPQFSPQSTGMLGNAAMAYTAPQQPGAPSIYGGGGQSLTGQQGVTTQTYGGGAQDMAQPRNQFAPIGQAGPAPGSQFSQMGQMSSYGGQPPSPGPRPMGPGGGGNYLSNQQQPTFAAQQPQQPQSYNPNVPAWQQDWQGMGYQSALDMQRQQQGGVYGPQGPQNMGGQMPYQPQPFQGGVPQQQIPFVR